MTRQRFQRVAMEWAELGNERFAFTLALDQPRFGMIIRQSAVFRETAP
jgi:hypothetical protein